MNPIKQKLGLTTDQGNNAMSVIWMAMTVIIAMPDTHARTILMVIAMLCQTILSYLTVGHNADPEYIETEKALKDVLEDGRAKD